MSDMNVTVEDIRRAMRCGGDVSVFAGPLHLVLGSPPPRPITSLDARVEQLDPPLFLSQNDRELYSLVEDWIKGYRYLGSLHEMAEIVPIGVPFDSPDGGARVERLIKNVSPDIVTIDLSPLALSSHSLYTFSMPAAAGLPLQSIVQDKEAGQVYLRHFYRPHAAIPAAIYRCYTERIPLVPVGMPFVPGYLRDERDQVDDTRRVRETTLLAATKAVYPEFLDDIPFAALDVDSKYADSPYGGAAIARREMLIEEAVYVASRNAEVASLAHGRSEGIRILALVDAGYYRDVEYTIEQYTKGIIDEDTYILPRSDIPAASVRFIAAASRDTVSEDENPSAVEVVFTNELNNICSSMLGKPIDRENIDLMLARIVRRVRLHPDTKRFLSVRGAIAFKEVLCGYADIEGRITPDIVRKAALATLPHRVYREYQGYDVADGIVTDAVKEVLYGFGFHPYSVEEEATDIVACAVADQVSGADYALSESEEERDAGELGDSHPDHSPRSPQGAEEDDTSTEVVPQNSPSGLNAAGEVPQQRTDDLFECVVERSDSKNDHIETARGARAQGRADGKGGSGAGSHMRTDLSEEALTETLMEMIDAQDRQWQKELNLRDLAVYYHLRGQKDGSSLNKMKQTQHGLKAIVEYLEQENLLSQAPDSESIMLTARAMDLLLEQLISKILSGKQIEHLIGLGATRLSEHGRDTRRYHVGDVFKDISIRHTLKELARQRKTPDQISRSDIRVFIREKERVQSDIVLCIDSSSSMGYHNKLLYARMAASGLAKSALAKGDRIGIVTFNNLGHEVISPVEDRQDIFERIISLAPGGNTNIGDGIKCAADLLRKERNRNQKFIVLITDGEATAVSADSYKRVSRSVDSRVSERDILSQARKAAVKGIKTSVIHCTAAGADHQAFVKNIARMGMGRVIKVTSLDKLRELMA